MKSVPQTAIKRQRFLKVVKIARLDRRPKNVSANLEHQGSHYVTTFARQFP